MHEWVHGADQSAVRLDVCESDQRPEPLRRVRDGVLRSPERIARVYRERVHLHLCGGLPRVLGRVRGQSQHRFVRNVVLGVQRPGERERDVRRNELRIRVQWRVSTVRRELHRVVGVLHESRLHSTGQWHCDLRGRNV
jgi:hypothetical protein